VQNYSKLDPEVKARASDKWGKREWARIFL